MKLPSIGWAVVTLCVLVIPTRAQMPAAYPGGYAPAPPGAVHMPAPGPQMPMPVPPPGVVPYGPSGHPGLVPLPHPGGPGFPGCDVCGGGVCDGGCGEPGCCDSCCGDPGCCDTCCPDCGFGRLGSAGFCGDGLLGIGCHGGGGWRARAEAVLLTTEVRSQPVTSTIDGVSVLSGAALQFDFEGGVRLSFERCLWCNHGLEFSYFGLHHWNDTRTVGSGAGDLLSTYQSPTGTDIPVYNGATNHTIAYGSELHSAELNYWLPTCCRWCQASFGLGVRCFWIEEDFDFTALDITGDTAETRINATNLLIGPQVASTVWFPFNKCVGLRFDVKFAILNNNAEQRTAIDVDAGIDSLDFRENPDTSKASVAGEVGFAFMMQVSCNVAMFVGYDAIFLEGLVLAPEQFNAVFPSTGERPAMIHDSASRSYHGAKAGLEITW